MTPTPAPHAEQVTVDHRERRKELLLFLFLTVVLAPVLAVLIVAGYGFIIWIYQTFFGLPGPQSL